MRTVRNILLAIIGIGLVVMALANAEATTLRVLPETLSAFLGVDWTVNLPMFAIILGALVVGVLIGMTAEFQREHKHRAAARAERRERQSLERKMADKREGRTSQRDEILSLLEDGSVPSRKAS